MITLQGFLISFVSWKPTLKPYAGRLEMLAMERGGNEFLIEHPYRTPLKFFF